jgi:hypothetical protein
MFVIERNQEVLIKTLKDNGAGLAGFGRNQKTRLRFLAGE